MAGSPVEANPRGAGPVAAGLSHMSTSEASIAASTSSRSRTHPARARPISRSVTARPSRTNWAVLGRYNASYWTKSSACTRAISPLIKRVCRAFISLISLRSGTRRTVHPALCSRSTCPSRESRPRSRPARIGPFGNTDGRQSRLSDGLPVGAEHAGGNLHPCA